MTIAAGETILAADINAIKDDVDAITSAARAIVTTSETSTSTSYTNLTTSGPAVTLTTGNTALVIVSARCHNATSGAFVHMSWAVTGASAVSADDSFALSFESSAAGDQLRASAVHLATGLTAGSNTFTAKYRVNTGTGTWSERSIVVIPLGD